MNVATTSDNQFPVFRALFVRYLPQKISSQVLFWASFPLLLLFFNTAISSLRPAPFTFYLPFFALVAIPLVLRYRITGLSVAYAALGFALFWQMSTIEPGVRLWHAGILFNLALTLYITLLAIEEIEGCLCRVEERTEMHLAHTSQIQNELQVLKAGADEKREQLEDEIERLKAEAEHRRIERGRLQDHLEWVQAEIELLNGQKNELIQEARNARGDAREEARGEAILAAAAAEAKLRDLSEQMLMQTNTLTQKWECRLQEWETQKGELEQANRRLMDDLITLQEAILCVQSKPPAIIERVVEKETPRAEVDVKPAAELQRALNKAQGLHAQLQSQFQEKSGVLIQTRSELFATKEKLEALEKEAAHLAIDPDRAEASALEKIVFSLASEISLLEEEIERLESLISVII